PVFRSALAGTHANLQRLFGNRHIRIDAYPDAAGALHVARERAPRRLDLAGRDAFRLKRLEAELSERKIDAGRRNALDTALVRLAKLGTHRLQHGYSPSFLCPWFPMLTTHRGAAGRHRLPPFSCPAPSGRAP